MKVAVCDDDCYVLAILEKFFGKYKNRQEESISRRYFINENELLFYLEEKQDLDIILLAVNTPRIDGFTIAEKIRRKDKRVKIIFLASLIHCAVEGYKYNAIDFLMKPLKYSKFEESLNRAVEQIYEEDSNYFLEKVDSEIYKIYFSDIIFIETYNRNTMIHTSKKDILSYKTLKKHEEVLDSRFFRCHIAYLINLDKINEIKTRDILLENNYSVPYSKHRKNQLMSEITLYYGEKL
ncbi:LytR/AlgR family response regulator transcription factor [Velocimicrobium porci]|uniref:Stage 0 sporulation protein A homolog n=1 Tax=Velocimicrobium porci TaxID=2606634 RepID=A0A6L5XZQ8_9FIRM|nr:LytTR family DNA-binding domain-containing protein [Velocimicrobium porci]MSS63413.1 response regulator transcription factor [Velocimicrobium porci]